MSARGYKGDKVVMTAKRETTGAPAKLVMTADRKEVSADGEDVAMFAVEVRDADDRVVPITENEVTFKISGDGKLIGVGNGDPTDQVQIKAAREKPSPASAWPSSRQRKRPEALPWKRLLPDFRQPPSRSRPRP